MFVAEFLDQGFLVVPTAFAEHFLQQLDCCYRVFVLEFLDSLATFALSVVGCDCIITSFAFFNVQPIVAGTLRALAKE